MLLTAGHGTCCALCTCIGVQCEWRTEGLQSCGVALQHEFAQAAGRRCACCAVMLKRREALLVMACVCCQHFDVVPRSRAASATARLASCRWTAAEVEADTFASHIRGPRACHQLRPITVPLCAAVCLCARVPARRSPARTLPVAASLRRARREEVITAARTCDRCGRACVHQRAVLLAMSAHTVQPLLALAAGALTS